MKKVIRLIILLFSTSFFLQGCKDEEKPKNKNSNLFPLEVSISEFEINYNKNSKIAVLDVRTPGEYETGHVPNSILLPLQDIQNFNKKNIVGKIEFSKEEIIYIICRSGRRSYIATHLLRSFGYLKTVSVRGGILAWINRKNKIEK